MTKITVISPNSIPGIPLIIILFLFMVNAENIGTMQIGSDIMLGNTTFRIGNWAKYEVSTTGLSGGFLIPIKFPIVDTYYRVRAAYHSATYSEIPDTTEVILRNYVSGKEAHYLSAINNLLVGKRFPLGHTPFSLLPQIGLGMVLETTYRNYGDGFVYDLVFFDISAILKYSFSTVEIGVMADFQHGFSTSNDFYQTKNRLDVSFVFSI